MHSERWDRVIRYIAVALFVPLLTACAVNSVNSLPRGSWVKEGHAILVYGVGVEGDWAYPAFGVELAEYSLATQNTTGNCFQFNRTEATVPSAPGPIQYFAFDVPPGHYVYSAFQAARLAQAPQAFAVPEGLIVYAGDFVYTWDRQVTVRRDLEALKRTASVSLPDLRGDIALAASVTVSPPKPFLCSP